MTKLVTDKCPCCGTRGLNPKKIKDMCENCLESSFDQWRRKVVSLEKENEELKKNALVWRKVTCFDKPDENGFITNDCPGDIGKEFLVRSKFGDCSVRELVEVDNGVIFEDCEWKDVDEWAELPEG